MEELQDYDPQKMPIVSDDRSAAAGGAVYVDTTIFEEENR